MLGKRPNWARSRSAEILTVIEGGTSCEGSITKGNNVLIKGIFDGELTCSESLVVAPSSEVNALIRAKNIYIDGIVRGTLRAEKVSLDTRARVIGDIYARTLLMSEGAVFRGRCHMEESAPELLAALDISDEDSEHLGVVANTQNT